MIQSQIQDQEDKMHILDIEKITDCRHLNLFSITYLDRMANRKKWTCASRSSTMDISGATRQADAVVVVPYHVKEEKLVLIKEFRVPLNGYQIGFPAGLLDKGETVEQAGTRELHEETGLKVIRVKNQSPAVYSSSGMTDEAVSLLYVDCEGTPDIRHNEASEDIEVFMISRNQASDLLKKATVPFDVKSWIVVNHFAVSGML